MKRFLAMSVLVGFVVVAMSSMAEEKAAAPAVKAEAKAAAKCDITGKLVADKKGEGDKAVTTFAVETKDLGKVELTGAKDLDKMVGKEVKATVEGEKAADGKSLKVAKVDKVEEVKAEKAAAPVAK